MWEAVGCAAVAALSAKASVPEEPKPLDKPSTDCQGCGAPLPMASFIYSYHPINCEYCRRAN